MTNEVAMLQRAIDNTGAHIDGALDRGDRRAFILWCRKRASLVARMETLLCSLALAPTP